MTYRVRLPGPTAVPQRVADAIALPVVNHRGPEFHAAYEEIQRLARPLFGTTGEILVMAASGTGAMEAALVNVAAPRERVLVVVHGQFGERFCQIATAMGLSVDRLDVEWGAAPDPDVVAKRLAAEKYRAVFVTHNESSTGAVADLAAIGAAVRRHDALLVVDAVSSLGGLEIRQDEWGIDVLVTASQKALMCPPGLGLAAVSEKAWAVVQREDRCGRFFWDFRRAKTNAEKNETAFTPPVTLIWGLREALKMIDAEGVANVLARHRRLAAALRAGCEALGLKVYTRPGAISDTVTVLHAPAGIEGGAIVRHLYQHHGTVIAGARNALAGKVIRIGTMGHVDEGDILTDLLHLEATLRYLDRPVKEGGGVAAAAAVLVRGR